VKLTMSATGALFAGAAIAAFGGDVSTVTFTAADVQVFATASRQDVTTAYCCGCVSTEPAGVVGVRLSAVFLGDAPDPVVARLVGELSVAESL
jgi:hypothetical protein